MNILGDDAAGIDAHEGEFLVVECDEDLLTRVVTNLLTNALEVSKCPKDVVIAARMDADELRVEVLDRGPGVADADKGSIFDKFVQAGSGASRTGTSVLGLTFWRLVLESHGGSLDVADREGGGAPFVFHLPRHAKTSAALT